MIEKKKYFSFLTFAFAWTLMHFYQRDFCHLSEQQRITAENGVTFSKNTHNLVFTLNVYCNTVDTLPVHLIIMF